MRHGRPTRPAVVPLCHPLTAPARRARRDNSDNEGMTTEFRQECIDYGYEPKWANADIVLAAMDDEMDARQGRGWGQA